MTAESLATRYTETAQAMLTPGHIDRINDSPIGDMDETTARLTLMAAATELAIMRLALVLACRDVTTGYSRRHGKPLLPAKAEPEVVT